MRCLPCLLALILFTAMRAAPADIALPPIPEKTVVLTMDDAVKSHRTFAGPLLKELGFNATFFVTHFWMEDQENFMSWQDIAELNEMGFEIGNHTWTHPGINSPLQASRLAEELQQVEDALAAVQVPKPISFAWPGNAYFPEAVTILRDRGYQLARRGMQPEVPYGEAKAGVTFVPGAYDPLLIPSTGDAYPNWNLEHFKVVVGEAKAGHAVVVQFHGVPDIAHPWVHTPPEQFKEYMEYLKQEGYHVIALRDLLQYFVPAPVAGDPHRMSAYPLK